MLLALNIGNTNLRWSIYGGEVNPPHTGCAPRLSADFDAVLAEVPGEITGVIICSVNPSKTPLLVNAVKERFSVVPLIVGNTAPGYEGTIGSDRIAAVEGALAKYDPPLIVFDFGTATTVNVVDSRRQLVGGAILPGVMTGIHALAANTALLSPECLRSHARLRRGLPPLLVGNNTRDCIVSGAVYGNAAVVDGMAERIGHKTVIATGGNAEYIIPHCKTPIIHEPNLLMEGLYEIFQKNRGAA
jgi:type III pantothenate kinase